MVHEKDEKKLYFRISKILSIQYIYIILFTVLGIVYNINIMFMNEDVHITFKVLPILLFIFSLSFFIRTYIENNKDSKYLIMRFNNTNH